MKIELYLMGERHGKTTKIAQEAILCNNKKVLIACQNKFAVAYMKELLGRLITQYQAEGKEIPEKVIDATDFHELVCARGVIDQYDAIFFDDILAVSLLYFKYLDKKFANGDILTHRLFIATSNDVIDPTLFNFYTQTLPLIKKKCEPDIKQGIGELCEYLRQRDDMFSILSESFILKYCQFHA